MIISPEERKEKLMEFVEVTERSPLGELLTQKSKSETVIKQLTRKLGDLPQELQTQISNANIETLELMLDDIFVINSIEEVKKYLG